MGLLQERRAAAHDARRAASGAGRDANGDRSDTQVCSCNNVSERTIRKAVRDGKLSTIAEVKSCTQAGTGCGGCLPRVTELLQAEMKAAGAEVDNRLCEHFAYSRQELFQIVKIKEVKSFADLIANHGAGSGCEICKPAVASILASLWNENVLDPATRRCKTPTTDSSPTSSAAATTRSFRAFPAARSRRRS